MSLTYILVAVAAIHLVTSGWTALYASERGHPWLPVLLAALFIGFPLPLLLAALLPGRGIR